MVHNGRYPSGVPPFLQLPTEAITAMARKSISFKQHARKHSKARNRTKAMNSPAFVLRGGRRL